MPSRRPAQRRERDPARPVAMAPKEKKAKEPEAPPSDWVARQSSAEFMACLDGCVTHLRSGRADAVRGKQLLAQGLFRLTFEVTHTSSPDANDLLIGVCDAAAWSTEESREGVNSAHELLQGAFGQSSGRLWQTFGRHGHAVAWGFEPKTGRVVSTSDVCAGRCAPPCILPCAPKLTAKHPAA